VCSRNLELKEDDDNTYCKTAKELNIKEKLLNLRRNIAIQGEIIGEGIQKNPYKLKGQYFRVFNTFNIDEFEYYSKEETELFCEFLKLETVPVLSRSYTLPETVSELLENVNGKSALNGLTSREGIVFVSINSLKRISFKAISNQYLLKNE
jgi:RNA ligase (TIGR02306 family)